MEFFAMKQAYLPTPANDAFLPPLPISPEAQARIHQLAEKYEAPMELESLMRRIYLLEKHAEAVDQDQPNFAYSAQEHHKVSMAESKAKHRMEEILRRKGMDWKQSSHLAEALTRRVVALAWENPNQL